MKKLHPNVRSDVYRASWRSSNENSYDNGSISFFGVEIDFEWNNKEKSWQCSFPHVTSNECLVNALDRLYKILDDSTIASTVEVFSDEAELSFEDFVNEYGGDQSRSPIFYSEDNEVWVLPLESSRVGIKLDKGGSDQAYDWALTPQIRCFAPTDVVYFYDDWM